MFDSDRIDLQLRLRLRSTAEADRKSCIGSPKSSITISISSPVKISADSRPTKAWYLESIPDTACHFIGLWALLRRLRCQANHTMTDRNPTVGVTCDVNSDLQVKFHKTFWKLVYGAKCHFQIENQFSSLADWGRGTEVCPLQDMWLQIPIWGQGSRADMGMIQSRIMSRLWIKCLLLESWVPLELDRKWGSSLSHESIWINTWGIHLRQELILSQILESHLNRELNQFKSSRYCLSHELNWIKALEPNAQKKVNEI